ncbi:hypothetical protein U1Q18_052080, partial [Sarracenia purpurea var. burkii]
MYKTEAVNQKESLGDLYSDRNRPQLVYRHAVDADVENDAGAGASSTSDSCRIGDVWRVNLKTRRSGGASYLAQADYILQTVGC